MVEETGDNIMHGQEDPLETRLRAAARAFPFPPTPDVSQVVLRGISRQSSPMRMRWTMIAIAIALILAILFAVPPVRAAVLAWIRIGAVRIYLIEPSPTVTTASVTTASPSPSPLPGTVTPAPSPTSLVSVLDLAGETSLADAQTQAGFTLRLPTYPAGLGQPEHVFYQDLGGPVVVLVWMDKDHPGQVRLALSETNASNIIFEKISSPSIENTSVNGQPAIWVDAPYFLVAGSQDTVTRRLIQTGHTLVWTEGPMTYRLETGDDLNTALQTAASLR